METRRDVLIEGIMCMGEEMVNLFVDLEELGRYEAACFMPHLETLYSTFDSLIQDMDAVKYSDRSVERVKLIDIEQQRRALIHEYIEPYIEKTKELMADTKRKEENRCLT